MIQTYPFSKRFVSELLFMIVTDKSNGIPLLTKLDPSLFSLKSHSLVFSILKQQKSFSGWDHLRALIELQFELGKIKRDILENSLELIDSAKLIKKVDIDAIRDIVKTAILRSDMGNALERAIQLYRDGEYYTISEIINNATDSVRSLDMKIELPMSMSLGNYSEDISNRKSFVERFPIGVYELDLKWMGGLGRGELGVVVAARKGGKSIVLSHIAQTAVLLGFNVVYFTFELLKDVVKHRISGGLLNIPVNDILWGGKDISTIIKNKMFKLLRDTGGDFSVKFAAGKSMSIEDIGVYLTNHEIITKRKVDMIIIDYADLVRPIDKASDYDSLDSIYMGARALGSPERYPNIPSGFNAAVWTGSQLTRESPYNRIITESDIARCIGKTDHLDTLLAVCRTPEEKDAHLARLYVPICRILEGGSNIGEIGPYSTDFEYGRIFNPEEVQRIDEKCIKIKPIDSLTDPFTTG